METDYAKIRVLQQKIDRIEAQLKEVDNLTDRQALSKKHREVSAEIRKLKQLELS